MIGEKYLIRFCGGLSELVLFVHVHVNRRPHCQVLPMSNVQYSWTDAIRLSSWLVIKDIAGRRRRDHLDRQVIKLTAAGLSVHLSSVK